MDGYLGRYRLDELLGSGGSAQVWRAHDTATGHTVALKVLAPVLAGDPEYRRRFEREARAASLLHGPHVVAVRAYGELEGRLYIESEFVDGLDVEALLEWEGPLAPAAAVRLIGQIAVALDEAHAAGLVHRDVKPQNIIVAPDETAYLIDFGAALEDGQAAVTRTGMLVGTPAYMAPERYSAIATARSDIYSLACVLYECLTGQRPFRSGNPAQLMRAQLESVPAAASTLAPAVSAALDRVIARAMAKDPAERYSSAGEFAAAAEAALRAAEPDSTAVLTTVTGQVMSADQCKPTVAAIVATAVAVVALAGSVIMLIIGVAWFAGHTASSTPEPVPQVVPAAESPVRESLSPAASLPAVTPEPEAPGAGRGAEPSATEPSNPVVVPAPPAPIPTDSAPGPRDSPDGPAPNHHGHGKAQKPEKPGKPK
ncbi:serine/threonine protein kinase [Nocardia yamanashiensis]|uniref:serine/threonine-protein kinase n=1 Tax=Nocardia yamanashiensis TaxID=209247 RepID=UPI001E304290|nr:serine/threonine-protein kinase [Nocardia yamanashiensis]UGT39469.1 serine/threonine protein kinase [Nocardia yamanashiensis]